MEHGLLTFWFSNAFQIISFPPNIALVTLIYYKLQVGDQVKVQFNRDGTSYIHSDNDHDVHFTGKVIYPQYYKYWKGAA